MSCPGVWYDTANVECVTEWNLIEDNDVGIIHEQDCYAWQDQRRPNTASEGQIDRYNLVRNNYGAGINLIGSRYGQVYGNTLYGNNKGADVIGQILLGLTPAQVSYERTGSTTNINCDLAYNSIRENTVSAFSASKLAVFVNATSKYTDGTAFDRTPCLKNTKENNFDFNRYGSATLTITSKSFRWIRGALQKSS